LSQLLTRLHPLNVSNNFPASDPQSATPYADLTQEQVMGWIQEYTPAWMFAEYTDKITAWIVAQYTPAVVNPPLPWTPQL